MSHQQQKQPLLSDDTRSAAPAESTSAWRWWILVWSSLLCMAQGWVWNTFGPISQAVEALWGWDDGTVTMMNNWGPIAYIVAFLPTSYLFDVLGLRLASLIAALLVAVGCSIRMLAFVHATSTPTWILVFMHVGQCLNGLAGPVAMMSGPVVSAAWFPPNFRTTSTAVITIANGLVRLALAPQQPMPVCVCAVLPVQWPMTCCGFPRIAGGRFLQLCAGRYTPVILGQRGLMAAACQRCDPHMCPMRLCGVAGVGPALVQTHATTEQQQVN
jgi:MFS family permease